MTARRVVSPHPKALLGPDSVSWRLCTPLRFLGLPRQVLMQLARPEIASAVADHSDFEADPLGRFSRTIGVVATVRFGDPAEVERTLDHLRAVHEQVRRGPEDGRGYDANDAGLQLWVLATGIDTTLELERRYLGALSDGEQERFYEEQASVFDAFQIPEMIIPENLSEFRTWMAEEIAGLEVTDVARRLGMRVVELGGVGVNPGVRMLSRAVTADLLPRRLRSEYSLTLGPLKDRTFCELQRWLRPSVRVGVRYRDKIPGHPGQRIEEQLQRWLLSRRAAA